MTSSEGAKVTSRHQQRSAYLYVRQSTMRQVVENQESTKRQYALQQRAIALGWSAEQIIVIDADQGRSGASSEGRAGFQQLVADVGLGRAGIVMGLEVSRLARNSTDWHRLLEICALTDTLILDEDGIYDPAHFNDRLLLGLKGTMSEAELHILRARLRGGVLSKARRGELPMQLPTGFVYDEAGQVRLDPDSQVREAVQEVFRAFRRAGSASKTVRAFREAGRKFPRRVRHGPSKGEVVWGELRHHGVLRILHHPRYAGAFCFGRHRVRRLPNGRVSVRNVPEGEWIALIRDSHEGYITWEEYRENAQRLTENARGHSDDRKSGPPREGPALLQGIVLCGVCGDRMTVRYHQRGGRQSPDYVCQGRRIRESEPVCQAIPGQGIDEAIGKLVVETMTPWALEVAMAVEQEIDSRAEDAAKMRQQELTRLRQEVELARRRYMRVDPDNRLVADTLEAGWNEKLREYRTALDHEQEQGEAERKAIDEACRSKILRLAGDFPKLFRDPQTPDRERKRMIRLLIEDVTLRRNEQIALDVRYRGGQTRSLCVPLPLNAWQLRHTSPQVIAEIDALLGNHTESQIASILNERGLLSGEGKPFRTIMVQRLRRNYGLRTRYDRLREAGMLPLNEIADLLGVSINTVKIWLKKGLLRAHAYNGKNECLYEHPGANPPVKAQGQKLSRRRRFPEVVSDRTNEVQCEA